MYVACVFFCGDEVFFSLSNAQGDGVDIDGQLKLGVTDDRETHFNSVTHPNPGTLGSVSFIIRQGLNERALDDSSMRILNHILNHILLCVPERVNGAEESARVLFGFPGEGSVAHDAFQDRGVTVCHSVDVHKTTVARISFLHLHQKAHLESTLVKRHQSFLSEVRNLEGEGSGHVDWLVVVGKKEGKRKEG